MYQIYPRNLARASSPVISATKLGRITLNAAAARIFVEKKVENVFLLWDTEARKFALKPTDKPDATAYQLRFAKDNAGAGFSAKPFLRVMGYDFLESRTLQTIWVDAEGILEATLPTEGFNRPPRFARTKRKRRNSGDKEAAVAAGAKP
jgi:hypothetical protein